jgi:hypothetical protein
VVGTCNAHGSDEKFIQNIYRKNLKRRDQLEDLGAQGRIISELILGKDDVRVWTGFIWLRMGTSGGRL